MLKLYVYGQRQERTQYCGRDDSRIYTVPVRSGSRRVQVNRPRVNAMHNHKVLVCTQH
jgi:hypothetical protein